MRYLRDIYLDKKVLKHPFFKESMKSIVNVIKHFTKYEKRNNIKKIKNTIKIYNDEKFDDKST